MMCLHDFYFNIQRVLFLHVHREYVRTYSVHGRVLLYTLSFLSVCCFLSIYSVSNFTLRLFCFFLFVFLVAGASAVYQVTEYSKYTNHNIVPYSLYGFIY
jgi:hypothetical protein